MDAEKEVLFEKIKELQDLVGVTADLTSGTNGFSVASGQLKGKGKALLEFEDSGVSPELLEETAKKVNGLIANLVKAGSYFNFVKKSTEEALELLGLLSVDVKKENNNI